jgi:hypothetical protein
MSSSASASSAAVASADSNKFAGDAVPEEDEIKLDNPVSEDQQSMRNNPDSTSQSVANVSTVYIDDDGVVPDGRTSRSSSLGFVMNAFLDRHESRNGSFDQRQEQDDGNLNARRNPFHLDSIDASDFRDDDLNEFNDSNQNGSAGQ